MFLRFPLDLLPNGLPPLSSLNRHEPLSPASKKEMKNYSCTGTHGNHKNVVAPSEIHWGPSIKHVRKQPNSSVAQRPGHEVAAGNSTNKSSHTRHLRTYLVNRPLTKYYHKFVATLIYVTCHCDMSGKT